jgi:hypothetical protein
VQSPSHPPLLELALPAAGRAANSNRALEDEGLVTVDAVALTLAK